MNRNVPGIYEFYKINLQLQTARNQQSVGKLHLKHLLTYTNISEGETSAFIEVFLAKTEQQTSWF